jgi:hypothetical protein
MVLSALNFGITEVDDLLANVAAWGSRLTEAVARFPEVAWR